MRHEVQMPATQVSVLPLVRSRRGRGQLGFGFFLAGVTVLGCAGSLPSPRQPECGDPPRMVRSPRPEVVARPAVSTDRIPFGLYSASAADFARLAQNGFTIVGPWYVPAPDRSLLDAAHAAGLGVVFPIGEPQGRELEVFAHSEAQTRASIRARVQEVVDHPAIVAWYVLPEEVRAWETAEFEYLRTTVAAIRAVDPHHRPILSYQPNHYDAAALAPVASQLDIGTKGMYVNYAGQRDTRVWVRWSVDELEAAGDAPVWVVPEMFEDPANADAATISAWVRHDVHVGLVAGARGVLVYSGFRRKNFARFDDYLRAYEAVALELNGPLALGEVLLRGKVCGGQGLDVVEGPSEVSFAAGGKTHRVPALGQLMIEHAGAQWLWLVNSSPQTLTLRAAAWASAALVSRSVGVRQDGTLVHLPAWGVAVLRRT